jgi:hypothetical protein
MLSRPESNRHFLGIDPTRVGLLLNFNVPVLKDGLKRMVL